MVKKADLKSRVSEIESKIASSTDLTTNSALTAVENIVLDVENLIKKTDYDAKISDIEKKVTGHDHDEYITTSEFYKLTTENLSSRLAQANLVAKTDSDVGLINLNKKINSNKTKHLLAVNKLKKLQTFDLSYLQLKIISCVMMVHRIILNFSQYKNIFEKLLVLIIFLSGSLKDYLIKFLKLLVHVKIFLILYYVILMIGQ